MLRRSYLSTVVAAVGISTSSSRIEEQLIEEREKPYKWEELNRKDKKNIRRYLKRRRRQGTSSSDLRYELRNLVGLASMNVEGSLSTADIEEFGEVTSRPTRVLPQFLIFTGSEAPRCPKCGNLEYKPAKTHPNKMRCKECSFLYTNRELASMVSPGM